MKRFAFLLLVLFLGAAPALGQPNLQAEVAAARAKYPTPMTPLEQASVVNTVAWQHRAEGFALLAKPDGNNCPQPRTGARVACDILVHRPTGTHIDVLGDAEGAGVPGWSPKGAIDLARAIDAVDPQDDPPTPPPDDDLKPLLVQLRAALAENSEMIRRLWDFLGGLQTRQLELVDQHHAMLQKLDALKTGGVTFPVYRGRVLGQPITLTPVPK
jgi:hypothetical protein